MKKKTNSSFDRFQKKSNAAVKEQFRQEKRKWKKEREEFFDKKKSEARNLRSGLKDSRPSIPRPLTPEAMPLNKFIAHCGVCSRRDAAELVKQGQVKVNNELITEPGHKVSETDEV